MNAVVQAPVRACKPPRLLQHPSGLFVLVGVEFWERFAFYGVRAIFVLYLYTHLGLSRAEALETLAVFGGLVYLSPLLGGYVADRWLGRYRAAVSGALLLVAGNCLLAFAPLLHFALGLIVLGTGFFKPCVRAMVGGLYQESDPRRQTAYTLSYMGINVGAFIAPLVCGTLAQSPDWGWQWAFVAAGAGMAAGLATLLGCRRLLGAEAGAFDGLFGGLSGREWRAVLLTTGLSAGSVAALLAGWPFLRQLWTPEAVAGDPALLLGLRLGLVLGVVMLCWAARAVGGRGQRLERQDSLSRSEKWRVAVLCILALFSVVFWTGLQQSAGTMTLFAQERTDLSVAGWQFPASYYQSLDCLFVIVLALPVATLWAGLDGTRFSPSAAARQGWGMVIAGLGFAILALADSRSAAGKVGPAWLAAVYLCHAVGEIMSAPVGIATVSRLSPPRLLSRLMALWLAVSAVASYLAGTLETRLAGVWNACGLGFSEFLCLAMVAAGLLLVALSPWLRRLSGDCL